MDGSDPRAHLAATAPHAGLPPSASTSTSPSVSMASKRNSAPELAPSARGPPVPGPVRALADPVQARSDPSHLAPEDAYFTAMPPRRLNAFASNTSGVDGGGGPSVSRHPRVRSKGSGSRSRSRRRKRTWKKLLWVKQSYPDNYTDQATFLENLKRNPSLKPYDFWPLVADSTVIVQHVCTVILFLACFVGIHKKGVSPVAVVGWGSIATSVGWFLWDWWVGKETEENDDLQDLHRTRSIGPRRFNRATRLQDGKRDSRESGSASGGQNEDSAPGSQATTASSNVSSALASAASSTTNLVSPPGQWQLPTKRANGADVLSISGKSYSKSAISLVSATSQGSTAGATGERSTSYRTSSPTDRSSSPSQHRPTPPLRGGRAHLRMNTIKSAILIYFTLLGLSPILKSLTRSTSSDSIWAMSFWLLSINIFFFDYSSTWVGVNKFPVASLSTNAALMASTVLASRLPSTGQVFSLTLFSIEVFGLFPVFRRYARHRSWRYHVMLTVLLVLGAGGGVGLILGAEDCESTGALKACEAPWQWKSGLVGMLVGCVISTLAMGGCSWWLIGLQKYKNEIYGPWDPARPIIISRRHWEDG